jgi:hypothetical protein
VSTSYERTDSLTAILALLALAAVLVVGLAVLTGVGRQSDDPGDTGHDTDLTCQRYGDC